MPGPGTREVGTPSGLCIRVQRLGFMPYPHNTVHHMWDGAHVLGACTPISSMTRERIARPRVTLHTLHMHQDVAGVLMQSHTHTPRRAHRHTACCKASTTPTRCTPTQTASFPPSSCTHPLHPHSCPCSWCPGLFPVPAPSVPALGTSSPWLTLGAPQVMNALVGRCQALGWGAPSSTGARVGVKAPIRASVSPIAGLCQVRGVHRGTLIRTLPPRAQWEPCLQLWEG